MSVSEKARRLSDIAVVIRSKNAGPYELTLDIILQDKETYQSVVSSGSINSESIASLYRVDVGDILSIIPFEPANAVKITIVRPVASGDIRDTDIYGAQQHAPLLGLEIV